jgi:hypothetical protein
MIRLWEIFVPCSSKNKKFTYEHHKAWDVKVQNMVSGLTLLRPHKGKWMSPTGETFDERMIPVRIACTNKLIKQIAEMTAEHYDQECVMYYLISPEVCFVERKK